MQSVANFFLVLLPVMGTKKTGSHLIIEALFVMLYQ
jgi:hypothetical protein